MRIAFYMTTVLEHGGGLEKYLIDTAANLSQRPDTQIDVITMDDAHTGRIIDLLSIFYFKKIDKQLSFKENTDDIKQRLGNAGYYKARTFHELRKKLNEYDIIYSKNELLEAFLLKFVIGYKRIPPVVFGGHTPLQYPQAENFHAKLHNSLYSSFLYKWLAGGVSRFHALNSYEATIYRRLFPRRPVAKIYNPFDIERFEKMAHAATFTIEQQAIIKILWVGRLTHQKGVHDLLKIIPSVNKRLGTAANQIQWNIVGDGELRPVLDELERTIPNVQSYGHIEQKYMPSIYQQHDVVISTSKWEGYPYTLIEPQAFGLQIFAYRIPGVSDILDAYDGGHLVGTNKEAMIEALSTQLKAYLSKAQVPRSQASSQFEPGVIYRQLIALLRHGETYANTDH